MWRRHMGFITCSIYILLVEEEDARFSRRTLGLVIYTAWLLPRKRGHLLNDFQNFLFLSLFCRPNCSDNVCHVYAPFRPIRLRSIPMPSICISTMSPSFRKRSSSRPDPPAAVPDPKTSPG